VRRKQLLTSFLLLIMAAVAFDGLTPSQAQQRKAKAAATPLITVLNPDIASQMVDRMPLSPRLDTLDGKTIYLVDINWGGPEAATACSKKSNPGSPRTNPA